MMKKILLLIFLLTISMGYSQGVAQDFETGGINGAPFASGAAPTVTREAGPGTNTTQVVKFVGNTGSQQWQGVNLSLTTNVNLTAATTRTMTIDVYANGPLFFLVKVNGGIAGAPEAAAVVEYTGTNTWQTCSFTFNSVRDGKAAAANGTYASFVLHPYWPSAAATVFAAGNAAARTLWVDNISGPLALPNATVGAFTIPSKLVGDATFSITPPTSNNTSPFTYASSNTAVGTIVNGNQIQVGSSGSSTITASQVSDGTYSATSTTATFNVTPPPPPSAPTPPARNAWDVVSLYSDSYTATSGATWQAGTDILTAVGNNARYFNGFTLARLAFGARSISTMTTLHIDVYTINQNQLWFEINGNRKVVSSIPLNGWASFDIPLTDYVGLNLGNVSFFDLNNPTGAAAPVKQVYLDNIYFYRPASDQPPTIGSLTVTGPRVVGDAPLTLTDPTSNSSGAWSYSASPAGILTFSGNTATIVGGGTATITATQAAVSGVYGSASTTASLVVNFPAPGPSPVPPVRDAASVVSLYTGTPTTYANVRTAIQASWSTGSTNSNFSFANGTDTCIQVNNLGFFGLVGNTNFSAAGMTKLHVDIYVNTPMTTMILNLLAPGDRNFSVGPLTAGWNSFDIPLSTYPGVLTDIAGIKFEQSGGTPRQIYIDNVYFYAGGTPTLTNFPAITKLNGDAPFSLTAPTSDSPGAFTYTSSNEAVATISGSTVTVVGQGTSTITATQAASGFFTTGSITATLTVTGSTVPLAGPTAPPARNAWDALSVFSDAAYTVIPGTRNYNPNWGQAGAGALVTAGSDNVWRASNLNYQGIVIGSNADVSAMTHFHVDVWTFNETSLQFFLISNTTGERSVALAAPYGALTQGSWISYDIPLTAWTSQSGFTTTAIKEFKIVGSGGKTIYMDNMYFYRAATTQPPTIGALTVPAQVLGAAPFTVTDPTSNSAGAFTYTSSNTAVATVSVASSRTWAVGNSGASDYTFSGDSSGNDINITATAGTVLNFNLAASGHPFWIKTAQVTGTGSGVTTGTISGNGNATGTLTWDTSGVTPGTYYYICQFHGSMVGTITITASVATITVVGTGSTTITATQAADGPYGSGFVTATLSVTPAAAPTPPTRNAWDVISLYSGAYTPSSNPNWGAAGADVSLSGDNARFFNGFTLARLAFAATNVSEMTHLHIDVFSLNQNPLWFELNGNRRVTSTPVNGWVSVDIALSEFVGLNLTNVSFFDLNNPTGAQAPAKQVYLDNIYFYRAATLQPPTLGALTVPTGVTMGDAPFVLTNPTTNSSGTFSYTSSNTAVATISGNTVTIVGGGSTTITATVASDGVYGPRSTTATLNVAFALPGASPIPPAREVARVMSVYTGTPAQVYANSPAYTLVRSSWTGGTSANFNFANGDNTCIQVNNLGFIGLVDQTERRLNVTGMTHLHLDVYCNTPLSNLFVFLLAPGDRNYSTGPLVAGWNSLSIPLTSYPGALNDIYGFKIEQNVAPNTTQIYLDNIYFSNDIFTYYQDTDGDGFGNSAVSVSAVNAPAGYVLNGTDCDDTNNGIWQTGNFYVDFDNDGYHLDLSPDPSLTTLCYGATLDSYYIATTLGADCDDNNNATNAVVTTTTTISACATYTWPVNGTTYNTTTTETVNVNSCDTRVLNLTITQSACLVITSATPVNTGCGVGSITVSFSGGTSPYTVALNGGSASTYTSGTAITGLTPNTYAIVITDASGSTATTSATITDNKVNNATTGVWYSTIQSAIDAATAGDVINVCAGTFTENVTVNKRLNIIGAGSSLAGTVVQGVGGLGDAFTYTTGSGTSGAPASLEKMYLTGAAKGVYLGTNDYINLDDLDLVGLSEYGVELINNNNINITNSVFTSGTAGIRLGTTASANTLLINGCTFSNNSGQAIHAFASATGGLTNVTITNNTMTDCGFTNNSSAMYFEKLSNASISNNTITNTGVSTNPRGIVLNMKSSAYSNVTIASNTLTENRTAVSSLGAGYAIRFAGFSGGSLSTINVLGNNIDGYRTGVEYGAAVDRSTIQIKNNLVNNVQLGVLSYSGTSSSSTQINDNSFTNLVTGTVQTPIPSPYAILNADAVGTPVAATCNWYGTATSATIAAKISGSVNYSPWLVNGTDNDLVTSGFQPVANSCTGTPPLGVAIKMNIQGFTLPNGMMRPVLANQGVGSSTTDVDNVTIELHNATAPFATFATTTAMLQTNGDAVATFSSTPVGSFYIVVKHRNSLETWSATPQTIGATALTYDFTDSASKAYGGNMILVGGKYAIYSGDITQDGFIEALDYTQLFNDSNNLLEGNQTTDLNGDGFVEATDYPILFNNSDNLIETLHP